MIENDDTDLFQEIKICSKCGEKNDPKHYLCRKCEAELPKETSWGVTSAKKP